MTLLQASIGSLNDRVDAPARRRPQAREADPGRSRLAHAGTARSWSRRGRRARPVRPVRPGDCGAGGRRSSAIGYRLRPRRSRGRPGRGSRSPWGSRSCRSSAGSARRAACPRPSRSCCRRPCVAGAALAIANARADLERDAAGGRRLRARGGLAPDGPWAVHAALLAIVVVAALLTLALGTGGIGTGGTGVRRCSRRSAPSGRASSSVSASPWVAPATRPDASEPGSSRRSASGCSRRPGWPVSRSAASVATTRSA